MAKASRISEFDVDWSSKEEVERFLEQNMDLVPSVIHKKCKNLIHFHDLDELVSEGYVGFLKAAKTYNPALGIRFSTYAFRCVRQRLIDYSRKEHLHFKREVSSDGSPGITPTMRFSHRTTSKAAIKVASVLMNSTVTKSENLRKRFKLGVSSQPDGVFVF